MTKPIFATRDWPARLENDDVLEVLIGGRWIPIDPGSFYEDSDITVFRSGLRIYETTPDQIQLRVAQVLSGGRTNG